MFERLLRPLTDLRGVRSVTLLEQDGFVIYRSVPDASNDELQRRRWPDLVAENGGQTVSLVFERGTVVACQTEVGCMVIHSAPDINLGALFPCVHTVRNTIRETKRGNGRP